MDFQVGIYIVTKIVDGPNFSDIPKAVSCLRMIEIVNDKLGSSNLRHL